jgi:outer membrane receptor protein involved in Fe transport
MDEHLAACPDCSAAFADALRFAIDEDSALAAAPTLAGPPALRLGLRLGATFAAAAALILALRIWPGRSTPPQPGSIVVERPPVTDRRDTGPEKAARADESGVSPGRNIGETAPVAPATAVDSRSSAGSSSGALERPAAEPAPAPDEAATPHGEPVARAEEPLPPPEAIVDTPAPSDATGIPSGTPVASAEPIRRSQDVIVVTASRVEQSLLNAPATMSVISGEALTTAPAQNIGDVLRSVPGANVIQTNARDFNMTARQATSTLANSTLVTVDGRSVYVDFLGFVLWDFVPSPASGDIAQIEVVRGPASVVWGPNAVNGVVNFITKAPRVRDGFGLVLGAGLFGRGEGSREAEGSGHLLDGGLSYASSPNDTWSYKLSAGYHYSEPFSRPVGTIPRDCHPLGAVPCRDANLNPLRGGLPIGGATYPADASVPGGFENAGTSQPKLYLRVDQDLREGGQITYEGGYGGTQGIVHTGLGPFALQSGSYMGFGRLLYKRNALRIGAFANLLDAEGPNLLQTDPATLEPVVLGFKTQTYDLDFGDAKVLGGNQILSYGANYRHNDFDITLAPGPDRNELGAYGQWEYFLDRFRLAAGVRADRFGSLRKWVWSPRLSALFKPGPDHSIRASYNRAFTSPSFVNNYLDQEIQSPAPIDLTPLAVALPPIAPLVPPPFLLTLKAYGNPQLREQSTESWELAYAGTFGRTTLGLAGYLSETDDSINFSFLLPPGASGFPSPTYYDASNPARGVTVPSPTQPATPITLSPLLMHVLAGIPPELGGPILLPERVATYLNFGPIGNRGIEFSLDHRFNPELSFFGNYSWQGTPRILDEAAGQIAYPAGALGLPPTHRFNAGLAYDRGTFFANANVNHASRALWVDVLGADYHGFSDGYALLNAGLGVRLANRKVMLSLKGTNLANQAIQEHIFGDVLKRSVVFELRFSSK